MTEVLRFARCDDAALRALLNSLGLKVIEVGDAEAIPGSFWGDEEAGLIGASLYLRADTPVHSILHESCHFTCMDERRRAQLHTNAGGDQDEENAVCYLQILLADALSDVGRERMCADMDSWGYSFRLGSAARWFREDATDARAWLERRGLLQLADRLTHAHGVASGKLSVPG